MYDWLSEALDSSSEVVTANRRLARVLTQHYAELQIKSGATAWRSPPIHSYQDWLTRCVDAATPEEALPTRINGNQSRVLWEQCLSRCLATTLPNSGALVRQAQEAWARLTAFGVSLQELQDSVRSRDQRVFADAAANYAAILERENWVDDARLPGLVASLVEASATSFPNRLFFAGFDRITPAEQKVRTALVNQGVVVLDIETQDPGGQRLLARFENPDAEMRAAGAWARDVLLENPEKHVAIVAVHLERDSDRHERLVSEGLAPGWQTGGASYKAAVNVSYGRRLSRYPAVAIALLALQWLLRDINSGELSRLLRSGAIGTSDLGRRAQMELDLRGLPSTTWTPASVVRAFRGKEEQLGDFLARVQSLGEHRSRIKGELSPSQWALRFNEVLDQLNWPGEAALSSDEFQLVNRWRELLNELSRLELVVPAMTCRAALARLQILALETVYQPESADAGGVQLIGPLEAAGIEFDCLWISGLSAANWPPQGNPSALMSRQMQRAFEMPDFEPDDTLAYASRVLRRLVASAEDVVCSYPQADGDAEQSPSGLLRKLAQPDTDNLGDPGWYARTIASAADVIEVTDDPVPPVRKAESVSGGTSTIQRQFSEPFSAFAYGRLGVRPLPRLSYGVPASVRGRLIHSALASFYQDIPSHDRLRRLDASELDNRLIDAARRAIAWLESRGDKVLRQFLQLEQGRIVELARAVVELDLARAPFDIVGVELPVVLASGDIEMSLRVDRVDNDGAGLLILDYKTGRRRQFFNSAGEPDDMQLVAYALAIEDPVSGLAFVNVDSRQVDISGAGSALTSDLDWDQSLARWRAEVGDAIGELQKGDVRLNGALPAKDSRAFGLLSRVRELQHEP